MDRVRRRHLDNGIDDRDWSVAFDDVHVPGLCGQRRRNRYRIRYSECNDALTARRTDCAISDGRGWKGDPFVDRPVVERRIRSLRAPGVWHHIWAGWKSTGVGHLSLLVDGEVVGGVSRVPKVGEARANMHVGARPEKTSITPREQEICNAIGPSLRENGLIFVGIDVIGGFLTEINVTSPTGIQEIDRFDDVNLSGLIWNAIEQRYSTESHVARS